MANALTDLLDDEDLHESARNFKKSAGQIKKTSKSIVKAAKGNIFEFPVFVANSVPLDYATATVSLLEQVYASYLQMAISINPIIDDKTAREGAQFDHLKSDTSKYLECVDPTDMPYAFDACHSVYTENGIVAEFNLVNIEDTTARIINEAMDHEPLSEFDHFFSETYSGDGAGFFEGCTWIQEANGQGGSGNQGSQNNGQQSEIFNAVMDALNTFSNTNIDGLEKSTSVTTKDSAHTDTDQFPLKDKDGDPMLGNNNKPIYATKSKITGAREQTRITDLTDEQVRNSVWTGINSVLQASQFAMKNKDMAFRMDPEKGFEFRDKDGNITKVPINEVLANLEVRKALSETEQAEFDNTYKETLAAIEALYKLNSTANLEKTHEKLEKELKMLENEEKWQKDDHKRQIEKDNADIFNKVMSGSKAISDIKKNEREEQWAREDRELDRMKKLNDARMKTPQILDETKIQKLNTMKPLMMSVDLNVVDKDGALSRPVSYVIGVKCHTRLIESNILPEVAAYPLKEMNNKLRKIKWRSGELKFGKDLLWKIGSKKQTAVDSHDKKRKWYRRLYELSHMSGDGLAAASVKNGKSPWANWWQDKLTGGHNKNVGHGLIPNATIVMSKSDVDNIKREKDIDLLSGSKAAKFCKELFLIGLVVIDDDAESVKVLLPDLHEDYDVMSIAAVKKQLAQLDTAGNKTRDIMKLLG